MGGGWLHYLADFRGVVRTSLARVFLYDGLTGMVCVFMVVFNALHTFKSY
jgi:hypothetical protein